MIAGIGIDMVDIKRMKRWREIPGLLERYFHADELSAVRQKSHDAASSLAARFAAKEAFGKALGTGLAGMALKDIMIKTRRNGQPELYLLDSARAALERSGAACVHVSLSHEGDNAIAMVVLEK